MDSTIPEVPKGKQQKRPAQHNPEPEPTAKKAKKVGGDFSVEDDILLKDGLQSTQDFQKLLKSVEFSARYTAVQLQERWRQMLYDPEESLKICNAMSSHAVVPRRAHYSEAELKLYEQVFQPGFESFEKLFEENRSIWMPMRTVSGIEKQFDRVKRNVAGYQASKPTSFEKSAGDKTASSSSTPTRSKQATKQKNQTSEPSNEKVVELGEEQNKFEFDWSSSPSVLAILVGKSIHFRMEKPEIIIGRKPVVSEATFDVDVNLSEEGVATKISRDQARITQTSEGEFKLTKTGKASILVDGEEVESEKMLPNQARLLFGPIELEWQARQ